MSAKYYTQFVLASVDDDEYEREFSGVVEVNRPTEEAFEAAEIEALLARNLNLSEKDLRLINWARLQ